MRLELEEEVRAVPAAWAPPRWVHSAGRRQRQQPAERLQAAGAHRRARMMAVPRDRRRSLLSGIMSCPYRLLAAGRTRSVRPCRLAQDARHLLGQAPQHGSTHAQAARTGGDGQGDAGQEEQAAARLVDHDAELLRLVLDAAQEEAEACARPPPGWALRGRASQPRPSRSSGTGAVAHPAPAAGCSGWSRSGTWPRPCRGPWTGLQC